VPEFLDEVRSRLAPLLPLGQRLEVAGPRYVPLRIQATVVASGSADPAAVRDTISRLLADRLSCDPAPPAQRWPFGRSLSVVLVKGWLRKVQGVARVASVRLLVGEAAQDLPELRLGSTGLPDLQVQSGDIVVERAPSGARS
jgi:hypothetical protein